MPVEDREKYVANKLEEVRAKKAVEQEEKERSSEINRREMVMARETKQSQ